MKPRIDVTLVAAVAGSGMPNGDSMLRLTGSGDTLDEAYADVQAKAFAIGHAAAQIELAAKKRGAE